MLLEVSLEIVEDPRPTGPDDAFEAAPGKAGTVTQGQFDLVGLGTSPVGAHHLPALFEQGEPDAIVRNQREEILINMIQDLVYQQTLVDPLGDSRQHGRPIGLRLQGLGQRTQCLPELRHFVRVSNRDFDVELSLAKGLRGLAIERNSGVVQTSSGGRSSEAVTEMLA